MMKLRCGLVQARMESDRLSAEIHLHLTLSFSALLLLMFTVATSIVCFPTMCVAVYDTSERDIKLTEICDDCRYISLLVPCRRCQKKLFGSASGARWITIACCFEWYVCFLSAEALSSGCIFFPHFFLPHRYVYKQLAIHKLLYAWKYHSMLQ